ncbi:MAG: hypothetical protein ABJB21_11300 [bacterium]
MRQKLIHDVLARLENDLPFPAANVCGHVGPTITWPNGKVDDSYPGHDCDRPRLRISVSYDGDPHSQAVIIEDYQERLADQKAKPVELRHPPALMLDWLRQDLAEFGIVILPETLASLTALRREAEAEAGGGA